MHESVAGSHDGDPDIDTLPFLAWSSRLLRKVLRGGPEDSPLARFMVSNQTLIYFPLLLFARLTWALQSFAYVFRVSGMYWGSVKAEEVAAVKAKAVAAATKAGNALDVSRVTLRYEGAERMALLGHWAWYTALMAATMDARTAAAYFVVSQTAAGLLIALAFGTGHNGMTVYDADKKPGFAELQVTTTRNVDDTPLVGWFMGGLHYQIEHHIFPTGASGREGREGQGRGRGAAAPPRVLRCYAVFSSLPFTHTLHTVFPPTTNPARSRQCPATTSSTCGSCWSRCA